MAIVISLYEEQMDYKIFAKHEGFLMVGHILWFLKMENISNGAVHAVADPVFSFEGSCRWLIAKGIQS